MFRTRALYIERVAQHRVRCSAEHAGFSDCKVSVCNATSRTSTYTRTFTYIHKRTNLHTVTHMNTMLYHRTCLRQVVSTRAASTAVQLDAQQRPSRPPVTTIANRSRCLQVAKYTYKHNSHLFKSFIINAPSPQCLSACQNQHQRGKCVHENKKNANIDDGQSISIHSKIS